MSIDVLNNIGPIANNGPHVSSSYYNNPFGNEADLTAEDFKNIDNYLNRAKNSSIEEIVADIVEGSQKTEWMRKVCSISYRQATQNEQLTISNQKVAEHNSKLSTLLTAGSTVTSVVGAVMGISACTAVAKYAISPVTKRLESRSQGELERLGTLSTRKDGVNGDASHLNQDVDKNLDKLQQLLQSITDVFHRNLQGMFS